MLHQMYAVSYIILGIFVTAIFIIIVIAKLSQYIL